jgi:hypothetical protein
MKCPFFNRCRAATGVPTLATDFFNKLGTADLLVISLQNITALAAFKKYFLTEDSRYDIPKNKP